jgi:hypothetical protein
MAIQSGREGEKRVRIQNNNRKFPAELINPTFLVLISSSTVGVTLKKSKAFLVTGRGGP